MTCPHANISLPTTSDPDTVCADCGEILQNSSTPALTQTEKQSTLYQPAARCSRQTNQQGAKTMTTASKLSNKTARQYFLHDCDTHEDGQRCCFFTEGNGGWGFWVREDGTVDIDDVSSNGELPPRGIIAPCVRAAVRHLRVR